MLTTSQKNQILSILLESLDFPDSVYQKAHDRYNDLGEWLCKEDSECAEFEPRIFAQGSFRLGTAVRPIKDKEDYDLDLVAKLQCGIDKTNISQEKLKKLVGNDLEKYRIARGIKAELDSKHRCWCLEYADQIKFHMDIIPCIPESLDNKDSIRNALLLENNDDKLSQTVSDLSVSITDDRNPDFYKISNNWEISNPEGYAIWFESRMRLSAQFLSERASLLQSESIDELPYYRWKTPLQLAIQILKRHRDNWAQNNSDVKPISIIITTLASKAYQGESDVFSALNTIINDMGKFVRQNSPKVPNPTNPNEDFADKWDTMRGLELELEKNFWYWLESVRRDFSLLFNSNLINNISDQAKYKFGLSLSRESLSQVPGLVHSENNVSQPDHFVPKSRPWGE